MKFGKELASQMVPEWNEAYMDYNFLKGLLREILRFQKRTSSTQSTTASKGSFKRKMSLYRAFSGLTNCSKGYSPSNDHEDEAILVTAHQQEGSASYRTTFLMSSDDGGEYELVFFRRLDDELNKVNKFYKGKVDQVVKEAEELNKQMDALIALRIRIEDPDIGPEGTELFNFSIPENDGRPGMQHMDAIEEGAEGSMRSVEGEARMIDEPISESIASRRESNGTAGFRPPPLQVLNFVQINIAPETPVSTLKKMFKSSNSGISFDLEGLKKVEEQIKQAFITFHQKLRSLKSYGFINQLAFSKIMKKYDKITSRNASKAYLKMVDKSFIGTSDEAAKLIDRVEATFIKHFSNGNRRNGLNNLRPQPKRQRHRTTFLLGLFTGCALALIVAIIVVINLRKIFRSAGSTNYMENIFPLYSLFGLIVLHMLMYAGNIYFWRRYRVNYPFIFGFKQGTELGYQEVLLLSSGLSVLALGAVISNLNMEADARTKKFSEFTELVPLGLVTLVVAITFCPFNIIYRSSRYFLIRCVFHCLLAPLYKVTLPDFFLADQLTSQVQAIRSLQFYVCYYIWGDFTKRSNTCSKNSVFNLFAIIVAVIPYWMRFLQCLRRFFEEKDSHQLVNGLKYFSTIVAVVLRTVSEQNKGSVALTVLAATSSGIATIASMYWDIVIDWGLLDGKSRNRWLRDKLLVPKKSVYFGAIVLNLLLRFAWLQSVLGIYDTKIFHKKALTTLVACLEIIRRGVWNFFRLENEHLNNVGKYRAFKTVPLPFNYNDDDEDKNI